MKPALTLHPLHAQVSEKNDEELMECFAPNRHEEIQAAIASEVAYRLAAKNMRRSTTAGARPDSEGTAARRAAILQSCPRRRARPGILASRTTAAYHRRLPTSNDTNSLREASAWTVNKESRAGMRWQCPRPQAALR